MRSIIAFLADAFDLRITFTATVFGGVSDYLVGHAGAALVALITTILGQLAIKLLSPSAEKIGVHLSGSFKVVKPKDTPVAPPAQKPPQAPPTPPAA